VPVAVNEPVAMLMLGFFIRGSEANATFVKSSS